ncbi:pseudoazurin [Aureimonas pseudogalii]|uniref:Pseudoazurin n=1 Tax=Aureimonas pseudogalii TaxID=1744844 RepID=A0A7W6H978_9HYPH|nr:pseudoazurin [Aureimonas pseudogalii]MBB4000703.1 pseudoazurin [Aureimonas pseudogalii]
MRLRSALIALVLMSAPGAVLAETVEVRMLNRGTNGSVVFEPDYVEFAPGDTLQFRVGHRSHNAAFIEGMAPDGFEGFKGQIDEEIAVTLDRPGFYGIKCSPHLGMGMVTLVKVGEATAPDVFIDDALPARVRKRFGEIGAGAGLTRLAP